jgi:hypothetical protein
LLKSHFDREWERCLKFSVYPLSIHWLHFYFEINKWLSNLYKSKNLNTWTKKQIPKSMALIQLFRYSPQKSRRWHFQQSR